MCPLRFVVVFFSVVLAGYFAWRTVNSSPEPMSDDSAAEAKDEQGGLDFKRKMGDGLWMFVDMASGRYLWRNLKEMSQKSQ